MAASPRERSETPAGEPALGLAGDSAGATVSVRQLVLEFAGVALVAAAVRALYLWQLHDTLPFSTLILDGRAYDAWAQRIAAGDWLGSEVFYQAPIYPYGLATLYSLLGYDPMLVRVAQAALSVCACLLLAWSGFRYFSRGAGVIAGLMLAIYPPAIFFDGLIQKAALDLCLMTLLLALLAELPVRKTWPWMLAAGIALGALTLNRENARILLPVLLAWLWIHFRDVAALRRGAWIAAMSAGFALVLLPVGLRNYYVGGEFLLTTSQLGPNFYIGNHAGASGRYEPLVPLRGDPQFERADATRLAEQAAGHQLSPREVSAYWLSRSWDYIRTQPGDWLRLLGRKCFLVFNAAELADSESIGVYADYSWLLRALIHVWHFGMVVPLAVLGVWACRGRWRELAVLYALFGALAASTALFFVFARYRFTLVPIALLLAAAALSKLPELVAAIRQRAWLREWGPGLLLAGLAAVACNIPLAETREDAVTYMNLGMGLLNDGHPAEAIEPLTKALAIQPTLAGAYHNRGRALSALKRPREAVAQYELALRYAPDFGLAHAELGKYYYENNRADKAIPHLQRGVELVPESPLLSVELAELMAAQGNVTAAISVLRQALHAHPDYWLAQNNLAWLLATEPDSRLRDGASAVKLAERVAARELGAANTKIPLVFEVTILDVLAAAYAEQGRFDEAIGTARKSLDAARRAGDASLAAGVRSRLELYSAHTPYRTPRNASPAGRSQ